MRLIFFPVLFLTITHAFSQRISNPRFLEGGVVIGLTNYAGDFTEKPVVISETKFGFGVFTRYHFSSRFALKAQLYTGNISGSDANSSSAGLRARSLRFKTNILDVALIGEWNVLNIKPVDRNGVRNFPIVPYLYLGIGSVMMNPQVEYYGPPEAFNQQVPYGLSETGRLHETALFIPVGGGLRMQLTERLTIGAEAGWRPVFSDQLDGVSLNGSQEFNDWYFAALASVSFVLSR